MHSLKSIPADAPPEPETAQGEYNPLAPEAPLELPALAAPSPRRKAELLAPAGSPDAGFAAFHYGADAIYLGLKKFSARAEAENFSLEEVDTVTAFAHALTPRRRVFVTVNTLILQHEREEMVEALGALSDIGIDAIILQDLGVYGVARSHFPELELHASTQLAVHNRAGAEALRQMGFTRVVLARELTYEEIRDITASAGIETEVFVHGALCYSYSGLCLFSSQTIGRSGNRGKCAYTCRDDYTITGAPETLRDGTPVKRDPSRGFPFSMKDLALPDFLPALQNAGVSCFKIEGRKKSPLYVATTTNYYRRLLDGTLPAEERAQHEADLQTVFSRPWTRLFVQSHKDKEVADRDATGHRGTHVGNVNTVVQANQGARLRFNTSRRIELHDGLQVDLPGAPKPFGFAVERLWILKRGVAGKHSTEEAFEAPAGSDVEVELPEGYPNLPLDARVYCSSSQSVKQRFPFERPRPGRFRARRRMDVEVKLDADAIQAVACVPARHAREQDVNVQERLTGSFTPAREPLKSAEATRQAFEKLGETRLEIGAFQLQNPQGLFVPPSLLNELRRKLTARVEAELDRRHEARIKTILKSAVAVPATTKVSPAFRWSIKVDRVEYLNGFNTADAEILDEAVVEIGKDSLRQLDSMLEQAAERIGHSRIRLALPAVTRKWEEQDLCRKIDHLRAKGWLKWEAGNLSAWGFLGFAPEAAASDSLEIATDWSVYVMNSFAAKQVLAMGARRITLSPEDGIENLHSLLAEFGDRATVIVHQDTPLFIAESCAYANLIGGCPGKANCRFESMDMVSSYGEKITALDYHCRTIVLNQGAYCLATRLNELAAAGAVNLRADFIHRNYAPEEVRQRWQLVREGRNVPGGHAANFDRGLL